MGILFSRFDSLPLSITNNDIGYHVEIEQTAAGLAKLIKEANGSVVVITGAGISSHQLPTFRSDSGTGLWAQFSPSTLAKGNFYDAPDNCWRFISNVRNLQNNGMLHPSLTHYVLHRMVQRDYIQSIITQNIDGLHGYKGDEDRIIELHGEINDSGRCETCNKIRPINTLNVIQTQKSPTCPECGAVLKPTVLFFGDMINPELRARAVSLCNSASVLILAGTHCAVDPVLSMAAEAKRCGAVIVEINIASTVVSKNVDLSLIGKADDIMREVSEILMPDIDLDGIDLSKWEKSR